MVALSLATSQYRTLSPVPLTLSVEEGTLSMSSIFSVQAESALTLNSVVGAPALVSTRCEPA
jgi:hypothetical protein